MSAMLRVVQIVVVLGALVGGGAALWRNRDKIKQTWESFGGTSGFQASKLIESAGPVTAFVRQLAQLKK
jgi:hypothetical protein